MTLEVYIVGLSAQSVERCAQSARVVPPLRRVGLEMIFRASGGLDLIGKAAVLKTAARKRFGVRVPGPPLALLQKDLRHFCSVGTHITRSRRSGV